MPDIQNTTNMISLPLWAIGVALLVAIMLAVVAIARVGSGQTFGYLAQVAASLLLVGVAWFYLDRIDAQDRAEQRRVIEARLSSLMAQALAPQSGLACLDSEGGDAVTESCEKTLYGSPEQVAAALAYVGQRIDIYRDMKDLGDSSDESLTRLRAQLARSLEADRFGFVAQVLQGRDNCTPEACDVLADLQQRDLLVSNMNDGAYNAKIARYAPGWGEKQPSGPALASQATPRAGGKPVDMNFPTAATIPPVSIMSNEPGMPGQNGMDSTTVKPEQKAVDTRPERERAQQPAPAPQPRRPAPKAAAKQPPSPAADPFPQPIAPTTTGGAPTSLSPQ